LTKLDILDDQPVIKIGVAYLVNGQKIDYYPSMCCSVDYIMSSLYGGPLWYSKKDLLDAGI